MPPGLANSLLDICIAGAISLELLVVCGFRVYALMRRKDGADAHDSRS